MTLKVLLPFRIIVDEASVARVSVDTSEGSIGLLPHRLDCVAAVVPGILSYQADGGPLVYVAVDEGVMVKAGPDVLISVRQAISGDDLGRLHEAVRRQFVAVGEQERNARVAVARMEGGFIRTVARLQHGK
jgi:F-type H+-transporting ATPase subunit epsilon